MVVRRGRSRYISRERTAPIPHCSPRTTKLLTRSCSRNICEIWIKANPENLKIERKCAFSTEAANPRWVVPFPTLDSVGPNTADKRTRLSMRGDATVATIRDPGFLTSLSIMGRPKVHPANRLRANTACTTCRASKKRCSGSFPCTNCIRKGRGRTCIPFKSIPDTSPQSRPSPATQTAIEDIPAWSSSSVNLHSPAASHTHDGADRQIERVIETGSRSPEATHRTLPRMLRNLQGERGI